MNITVIRDSGDKVGNSISDSLLTTTAAGVERGRIEIDSQYYNKLNVKTQLIDFTYLNNCSFISTESGEFVKETVLLTGVSASYKADQAPVIEIETERLAE